MQYGNILQYTQTQYTIIMTLTCIVSPLVQIQKNDKTIYNLHAILKSHLIQWPLHFHIALLTYKTGACLLSG